MGAFNGESAVACVTSWAYFVGLCVIQDAGFFFPWAELLDIAPLSRGNLSTGKRLVCAAIAPWRFAFPPERTLRGGGASSCSEPGWRTAWRRSCAHGRRARASWCAAPSRGGCGPSLPSQGPGGRRPRPALALPPRSKKPTTTPPKRQGTLLQEQHRAWRSSFHSACLRGRDRVETEASPGRSRCFPPPVAS